MEKNIFRRMADITAELQTVAKNLTVETGRGSGYKAVSERDVIDAVKPLEEKHGVYSYPFARQVLESQTLESETSYTDREGITKVTSKTTFFTRIQTTYRFVNVDDPDDYIETVTFAEGIDAQDKGSGKAMTYSDKYALMKAYKISTGDDPDQTASVETVYKKLDPVCYCEDCTLPINPVRLKNGEMWKTSDIVTYSKRRFGRQLCHDCQRKAEKAEKNA